LEALAQKTTKAKQEELNVLEIMHKRLAVRRGNRLG
jgi:hypothetical protein